jgi:REP element-mobilizing transposase RayT
MNRKLGFYNHGRLPHYDAPGSVQFITFRLADSLPVSRAATATDSAKSAAGKSYRELDDELDAGIGNCILSDPKAATVVRDAILFRDQRVYDLLAWVVMPNHVHLLIRQHEGQQIGAIVKSLKTYTANRINKLNNTGGSVWQSGYFDRVVRDEKQQVAVINYIHENPVKACLALSAQSWCFSSYRASLDSYIRLGK